MKRLLPVALLAMLLAGCTTPTITNLTPSRMPRNSDGLYPFQVAWKSQQQSLVKDSIKPYVQIGTESYPMQPTPLVSNRWEAVVPLPADKDIINYRYKFDYEYYSVPIRRPNSKLSPPYQLQILEK